MISPQNSFSLCSHENHINSSVFTFTLIAFAQKSDSTTFRLTNIRERFIEHYTFLKSKKNIKNGYAEVLFNPEQMASGYYGNNERVNQ